MQRIQIVGYYLAGVMVIIALAVWGVSLRRTVAAEATTAEVTPPSPVENQPSQLSTQPGQPPATVQAEIDGAAKVSINNFQFVPQELTITVGTTVTWINSDDMPHTATSTSKPSMFHSKLLDTNEQYSFQFKTPGTYPYYCKAHPQMLGRIVVK